MKISIHALREEGDAAMSYNSAEAAKFLSTPSARRATKGAVSHWYEHGYFYPRPPRGGRHTTIILFCQEVLFLSTPSARRATLSSMAKILRILLFLSTPSARRATSLRVRAAHLFLFLSTPSARRATGLRRARDYGLSDFYPRPPRGGRQVGDLTADEVIQISIHALREEGDLSPHIPDVGGEISIHALREEGDTSKHPPQEQRTYFYPRPPRGGRRGGIRL